MSLLMHNAQVVSEVRFNVCRYEIYKQ